MVHDLKMSGKVDSFSSRIDRRAYGVRTWLCIGIDPDPGRLPTHLARSVAGVTQFCTEIIEATHDLTTSFKLNFAFFESLGSDGWRALEAVRRAIPSDVPVIADAKRGDIPHTAAAYARSIFDVLEFDAVTVSPYIGWDSIVPFTEHAGTCVFVLCKTSNPGASALQDLPVDDVPLYLRIARDGLALTTVSDLGFVVGATQAAALQAVRALSEDVLLLVPGVGAQGADAETALLFGGNRRGDNAIVPISREIMYASPGADFADAARTATEKRARELWMEHEPTNAGR
jgi:orotidine-5'-phosphate decarboxylase